MKYTARFSFELQTPYQTLLQVRHKYLEKNPASATATSNVLSPKIRVVIRRILKLSKLEILITCYCIPVHSCESYTYFFRFFSRIYDRKIFSIMMGKEIVYIKNELLLSCKIAFQSMKTKQLILSRVRTTFKTWTTVTN